MQAHQRAGTVCSKGLKQFQIIVIIGILPVALNGEGADKAAAELDRDKHQRKRAAIAAVSRDTRVCIRLRVTQQQLRSVLLNVACHAGGRLHTGHIGKNFADLAVDEVKVHQINIILLRFI